MNKYIFYECGKGNQSYNMMNVDDKSIVYEVNLDKFRLLSACDYTFKQPSLGKKSQHKIGKTVTVSQGYANDSWFKLDGINVKNILDDKGYENRIEDFSLLHPSFTLNNKEGVVAKFRMNVKYERPETVRGIGKYFLALEIETNEEDLFYVVLQALVLKRCQITTAEVL